MKEFGMWKVIIGALVAAQAGAAFAAEVTPLFRRNTITNDLTVQWQDGTWNPLVVSSSLATVPFSTDGAQLARDVDYLRAWCYKGDGASHALSTVTSCGTTNTTGWTLAQWQAKLPSAVALTDEIDWTAIQSAIDGLAVGSQTRIFIPGTALLNRTIVVPSTKTIALVGAGDIGNVVNPANLTWTADVDGIRHIAGGSRQLVLSKLSLSKTPAATATIGIDDQEAQHSTFEHVRVVGWNNGIKQHNPAGTRTTDLYIYNGLALGNAGAGEGFYSECSTACFVNSHESWNIGGGFTTAVHFKALGPSGAFENGEVRNLACGGKQCAWIESDYGYAPLMWRFTNIDVNVSDTILRVTQGWGVEWHHGYWGFFAPVGAWTGAGPGFVIGLTGAPGFTGPVTISDGIVDTSTVSPPVVLDVQNVNGGVVRDMFWRTTGVVPATAWIRLAVDVNRFREQNSLWGIGAAPARNPPANAIVNAAAAPQENVMESYDWRVVTISGAGCSANATYGPAYVSGGSGTQNAGTATCTMTFPPPLSPAPPLCTLQSELGYMVPFSKTVINNTTLTFTNTGHGVFPDYWTWQCISR